MEYINYDADYPIPKTAEEVFRELEPTFYQETEEIEQSDGKTKEYFRQIIEKAGGDTELYEDVCRGVYHNLCFENESTIVERRLDDIQAKVDLRIELCEIQGSYNVRDNEEFVEKLTQEVRRAIEKECSDLAALYGYEQYMIYRPSTDNAEVLISGEEACAQFEQQKMEEEKKQMIERFEAMAKDGELEYVVRGAPIMCMYGSHSRHLDMYHSHGIYVNQKAVAFEEDCIVDKNISYFGHCNAPGCTLTETISLKLGAVVNAAGVALQDVEDSIHKGIKCVPDFDGKWQNAHLTTLMAKDGGAEVFGDGFSPYNRILTTASYLVCKQGGLVYPLASGQIDEAYYHAPFQAYPFNDFGSEAFYKWCEMKDICPTIAGQPGHTEWHQKKIDEAMANYIPAKEAYDEKYPSGRAENTCYTKPGEIPDTYDEYLDYFCTRQKAKTAYENCLIDADRVGAASMPYGEMRKYGNVLQDFLDSGLLMEHEKEEVMKRYSGFLKVDEEQTEGKTTQAQRRKK